MYSKPTLETITRGREFWLQQCLQFAQQSVGKKFGRDIILPIKYRVYWGLIRHKKQTQINKCNAHENKHIIDYDYKVGDKFVLNNQTAYKY